MRLMSDGWALCWQATGRVSASICFCRLIATDYWHGADVDGNMTAEELQPYECVADPTEWWHNYAGPCCKRRTGALRGCFRVARATAQLALKQATCFS